MKTFAAIWTAISLALIAAPVGAASCRDILFEETSFTVCEADPKSETIRLFLNDAEGRRRSSPNVGPGCSPDFSSAAR